MTVSLSRTAFVATKAGQSFSLSQIVTITGGSGNPAYIVLSGLDRNEYTAAATDATGVFDGNEIADTFVNTGGDFRSAGIVFTYNTATGQYVNATYGSLTNMVYTASGSANDLVNIALYGFSNGALAVTYANDPVDLIQLPGEGYATYIGSASIATEASFTGTVPTQATPDSIASTALSFVGQAWNESGCWVLASDISTEAGAALPVTSTEVGIVGLSSGEWFVAYDGPVSASANWESQVHAGEVISFETGDGGGHVVTVVSGSGSSAMIVDNTVYNIFGTVINSAGDGSSEDVKIVAPHPLSAEDSDVPASSVVIYELDTPVVTADTATTSVAEGSTTALAALFSAVDPKGTAITEYRIYESNASDSLTIAGVSCQPTSANPMLVASLSAVSLAASNTSGTDNLDVQAYNGSYWGDWAAETINTSSQLTTSAATSAATTTAITLYYNNILERAPDTGGLAYWVGAVTTGAMTLTQVEAAFIGAPEAQAGVVPTIELYTAFGRIPDADGLNIWVTDEDTGTALSSVAALFLSSTEGMNLYGSSYGIGATTANVAFVTTLYAEILGRATDAGGLAYWTTALTNGTFTGAQVLLAIATSPEATTRYASGITTLLTAAGNATTASSVYTGTGSLATSTTSAAYTSTTDVDTPALASSNSVVNGTADSTTSDVSTYSAGDTIFVGAGSDTITLVPGHIGIDAITFLTTNGASSTSFTTIANAGASGTDTVNFATTSSTLALALTVEGIVGSVASGIAGISSTNEYTDFTFGGNTYVYQNTGVPSTSELFALTGTAHNLAATSAGVFTVNS